MFGSGEKRGQRILVVDDDRMMLELLTTRLKLAGYDTYTARDGIAALEALSEANPAAMVLDISMPRLDGFGVLATMRDLGLTEKIPVMVLTARNQGPDVQKALSLGARDFIAKPFEDRQLLARVARLLRKPAAETEAEARPPAKPTQYL